MPSSLDKDLFLLPNRGREEEDRAAPAWGRFSIYCPIEPRPRVVGQCLPPGSSLSPVPAYPPPTSPGPVGPPIPGSECPPEVSPLPHTASAHSGTLLEVGHKQDLGCEQRVTALPPPLSSLCQGQVTRAQEAEENYVIKRELAVVRQQCSSATEDLQKAQSTIRQLQEQQVPSPVGGAAAGRPRPRPPRGGRSSRTTGWGSALQFLTAGWGTTRRRMQILCQSHRQQSAPDPGWWWGSLPFPLRCLACCIENKENSLLPLPLVSAWEPGCPCRAPSLAQAYVALSGGPAIPGGALASP